jgi:hypothetical protein
MAKHRQLGRAHLPGLPMAIVELHGTRRMRVDRMLEQPRALSEVLRFSLLQLCKRVPDHVTFIRREEEMNYILLEYIVCSLAVLGSALLLFGSVLVLMLAGPGVRLLRIAWDMITRSAFAHPPGTLKSENSSTSDCCSTCCSGLHTISAVRRDWSC